MSEQANSQEPDVMPGTLHEDLQGTVWQAANPEELKQGLEKAFDYRGDVTITTKDGTKIEGYIFDRQTGKSLDDSVVRLIPKDQHQKIKVRYADIAGLVFTGRDTAAGKSWEAWMKKYWEKKAAGEKHIALEPEALD